MRSINKSFTIHTDNLDANIHRKIPSYQGFTVDRLKNIYIACGAGPENTHNYRIHDYDNEIICLPNYGRHKKNEAIH